MQEAGVSFLTTWQTFYVIIGSAAATLTGLMFVVISAILRAPWQAPWYASLLLGLSGLGGVIYVIIVLRRTRRQTDYQPVLEDWLWYTAFPFISYTALVVAAIVLPGNPSSALFGIGASSLLPLFTGIHNAWDTVIYIAIERSQPENKSQD